MPLPPRSPRRCPPSALRAQFQTRQRETLTWSATIVQTLTLPGLRDPVVSTGTLSYRAPDRLRLDFTKPAGEFVLVLGDRLFIQKTGARLAEKSLREDSAGKPFLSLLGLLRGQSAKEESDYTAEVRREEDRYAVVLTRNADASSRMPARIANAIAAGTLEMRAARSATVSTTSPATGRWTPRTSPSRLCRPVGS